MASKTKKIIGSAHIFHFTHDEDRRIDSAIQSACRFMARFGHPRTPVPIDNSRYENPS